MSGLSASRSPSNAVTGSGHPAPRLGPSCPLHGASSGPQPPAHTTPVAERQSPGCLGRIHIEGVDGHWLGAPTLANLFMLPNTDKLSVCLPLSEEWDRRTKRLKKTCQMRTSGPGGGAVR